MTASVIGNYKIVDKIGEGGMGAVYKGVDLMLEREVAIKALRPELARQPHLVERFRAEAVTLAKLNHPNIATLHSFFRQGDDYFMVMEFVRGETLDAVLRRAGGLVCDSAVLLFCQALEGIDHAHKMGIVHRDIKPANIMLTESGSIKVMDFGIARVLGSARMTKQGNIIGTVEYMSPEQVRGHETDSRSDIYSLGILLYEMLTGHVPFNSPSEYELMRSQIEDPPPPPRDFAPHIPLPIEEAIMKALAKKPDARFQTAGDFRRALLSGLQSVTGSFGSQRLAAYPTGTREGPILAPGQSASHTAPPMQDFGPDRGTADHLRGTTFGRNDTGSMESQPFPSGIIPKETRLSGSGAQAAPVFPAAQPTEPGSANSQPGYVAAQAAAPAAGDSFLSKLNWKHFVVAAGVMGLLVIGAVALLITLVGSSSRSQAPTATQNNTAAPPPQTQQLQPQAPPATGLNPAATGQDPAQPQVLDGQTGAQQNAQQNGQQNPARTDRGVAVSRGRQGASSDSGGQSASAPVESPAAPVSSSPAGETSQPAAASRPSSQPHNSSSASSRQAKAQPQETPKEEKKKGLFGKLKGVFKHDSDKDKKQQ